MTAAVLTGWDRLRHGGLLLDLPRLRTIADHEPGPLPVYSERDLKQRAAALCDGNADVSGFVAFVLEHVCGFDTSTGRWVRGTQIGTEWSRRDMVNETIRPQHLWRSIYGSVLPVFIDDEPRLGIGKGRRAVSRTVQWLRAANVRLGVLTNGRYWRLIFAGLDFDAWCEWDVDLWFEQGMVSPQLQAFRTVFSPVLWTAGRDQPAGLLQAVQDSRKGQAELSAELGERIRESVEMLVQAHGDVLRERCADVEPADIYRAAVRMVMRMVVVLFAESRDMLPRDNPIYHSGYGINGLMEELDRAAVAGGQRLDRSWNAWPRLLALFRLVFQGSHHPALPVPAYGGDLFAPGDPAAVEGLRRAIAVFEQGCFDRELLPDRDVHHMLRWITSTRIRIRQGRTRTLVPVPVDFSDLSSEYIGILYEGLLDFELKTAPAGDPVIFLAIGNQPALPLSRLESMDDAALMNLLEKMTDTSREADADAAVDEPDTEASEKDVPEADAAEGDADQTEPDNRDERHATRTRAEQWARRAVEAGKLVRKPRGTLTPEKKQMVEQMVSRKARQLVTRVILPGEWYLVRWGGTRKGAGTFYTPPGLAGPTVHRTLRPLVYDPPLDDTGVPDPDAPGSAWVPRKPEEILSVKVCDPACGSGTFPVEALRVLTDALALSVQHHQRLTDENWRKPVSEILGTGHPAGGQDETHLLLEPSAPGFDQRLRAVLCRHVVERCIYGVDLDPLAVELCRVALWIETMDPALPFSFLDHKIRCGNSLIGAWFDQFRHYPVMAWKNREGGDKGHTNGVHFRKEARTQAIRAFARDVLPQDMKIFLEGRTLFSEDLQKKAETAHAAALATIDRLHALPVQDHLERSRIYQTELLGSDAYQSIRSAMDLWCACWFWPADALDHAPRPTTLGSPSGETRAIAAWIANQKRFFHWELEFPDVFTNDRSGFDAILGNPPWETLQPVSMEFFSNIDPLYRSYGKQEALHYQTNFFTDIKIEQEWLDYNAGFSDNSNWMKYASIPFGDPESESKNSDHFPIIRGRENKDLHEKWRKIRSASRSFASSDHPFRYQGEGKAYTYKLFLEQAHTLLRLGGRMGLIVPSGLYSDHGTGALRSLFLDRCQWEWLFGFENRDGIFDIDSRFKFNPVIIGKGGVTGAISTAFMRRRLEDWEDAENYRTPYQRSQIDRFSPHSKSILEIQSARDLEILEKIYANSVLLGDKGPGGWGIQYAQGDFNMTSDSKLFPPRPKWEAEGYRPDEYSRWLKGDWQPIGELWRELEIDPGRVVPIDADYAARMEAPDVQKTDWRLRCSQPPYDTLPIPRAEIPAGIILSRNADQWIREDRIEDIALPLYEGRMIGQFDFSQKGWVSGKGRTAVWEEIPWERKIIGPQYLMSQKVYLDSSPCPHFPKISHMRIGSATNERSAIASVVAGVPTGDTAAIFFMNSWSFVNSIIGIFNSFVFDYVTRNRLVGLHLDYHVFAQNPLPIDIKKMHYKDQKVNVSLSSQSISLSPIWCYFLSDINVSMIWRSMWGISIYERQRLRIITDAISFVLYRLDTKDAFHILNGCDFPTGLAVAATSNPKGFWRVDKDKDPELRQPVLTLVAFRDLEDHIRACGGDRDKGIDAFLSQNNGDGWMIPETLRLADYGLGHDDRAQTHQPVASRLGPRFYDWQLGQTPEESWNECHLHARNLLGDAGYRRLLAEIEAEKQGAPFPPPPAEPSELKPEPHQRRLFEQ